MSRRRDERRSARAGGGRPAAPPAPEPAPGSAAPARPAFPRLPPLAWALLAAALVAATVAAYWPSMRGPFLWDDAWYVEQNAMVHAPGGWKDIWSAPSRYKLQFYPVTYTSLWANWQLHGADTFGYHLANTLLHAANALLLALLLRRLEVRGALAAGLLFALHPVHVESVAWICERKNVLSLFFALLAALAWWRHARGGPAWTGAASVAGFVLGFLAKTNVALLVPSLALLAWWRVPRRDRARAAWPLAPMAVVALLVLPVTAEIEARNLAGTSHGYSAAERVLIAGRALAWHVGKLLWPDPLMPIHPKWDVDPAAAWQWLFPAAVVAAVAAAWRYRERIGTGVVVALGLFVLLHVPTLGFKDFGFLGLSYVSEHFDYLPSLPFLALLCAAAAAGLERFGRAGLATGAVLAVIAAAALGVRSWHAAGKWADAETFWRHSHESSPNHQAAGALGDVYLRRGDHERALPLLEESLRLKPNSRGHYRIGELYQQQGRREEAIAQYEKALELNARTEKWKEIEAGALFNMGSAWWGLGDVAQAASCWRRAAAAQPENATIGEWLAKAEARLAASP